MHRIDHATAAIAVPTPATPGTPGYFFKGDPTLGTPATVVTDDWANAVQEELCHVIEQAGLTLSKTDRTQLAQALATLYRRRLSADLTVYVATTGNDTTGDGTALNPWATMQHAWDSLINDIDCNGHDVTIQVEDGTHTSGLNAIGMPTGAGTETQVTIQGNVGTPSACVINTTESCFMANRGVAFNVKGFRLQSSGTSPPQGCGVRAVNGGTVGIGVMEYGTCALGCVSSSGGSVAMVADNFSVIANGYSLFNTDHNGVLIIGKGGPPMTITLVGTPNFSQATVVSWRGGDVSFGAGPITFAGGATGIRFNADNCGIVSTGTGTPNTYIPGSSPGTTTNGGQAN